MVSAVPTSDLDLDLCAQEPIRLGLYKGAGSIQPHGMLVVVDPDKRQIVQASANAAALGELIEIETFLAPELRIQTSNTDVRAFTVETVRELGYDALQVRDGNSALNVLRRTPADKIDLLFSDVVLPGGVNGQQLITKPFAFEDLAARLRSVLDGQDSSRHVN
jgi:CheY-like chemotaxis protein